MTAPKKNAPSKPNKDTEQEEPTQEKDESVKPGFPDIDFKKVLGCG